MDPEVDADQLDYIRAELRKNGHVPLMDAVANRLSRGSLGSEESGRQYLPDHGVSKPVWRTSREVDANTSAMDLSRPEGPVYEDGADEQPRDVEGRFMSTKNNEGEEPSDQTPATEGQESLPAGRQSTPSTVRVKVGEQELDLTPDQIADAWKTSRKAKEIEADAQRELDYAKLRGAAANAMVDLYESASPEERRVIDRMMHQHQGRKPATAHEEPREEDADEPEDSPPRRASAAAVPEDYHEVKRQLATLLARDEAREQQARRESAKVTVDSLMQRHEVFKDPALKKLAMRSINAELAADPNADVDSLVASLAADAGALVRAERRAEATGGRGGPAALGGQSGTPSKPLTGADLKNGKVLERAEARLRSMLR